MVWDHEVGGSNPLTPTTLVISVHIHISSDPPISLDLASVRMPYGKYADYILCDLSEHYIVGYYSKGFPRGRIAMLLSVLHEIKLNGLEYLLKPLRKDEPE